MQVIDSDGHLHEPFDLFERYMEKEFYSMRPRIVDLRDEARDTGRWLVEGRLVPRLPFTKGVGGGGFRYQTPRHEQMKAKDNSLDDIEGRLLDMDRMEIDFQIVYPTALVWAFDLENKELAAAVCRAYNDYVAEQCAKAPKRLGAVALVPIQDPAAATTEARRAVQKLGLNGVVIPGIVGNTPLHAKEFVPFFETMNELDCSGWISRRDRHALHALGGLLYGFFRHPRDRDAVLDDGGDDVYGPHRLAKEATASALRVSRNRRELAAVLELVGGKAHRACPRAARRPQRERLGKRALRVGRYGSRAQRRYSRRENYERL